MKKKTILAVITAVILTLSLVITACGGSTPETDPDIAPGTTQDSTTTETQPDQETVPSQGGQTGPSDPSPDDSSSDEASGDDKTIVLSDGHAIQPNYPLNETSISKAMAKFQYLYDSYLKDTGSAIYTAIVPDKGYYLQDTDLPHLDYEQLFQLVHDGMPYATHVDLTDTLSLDAYYYTDIHWRQEYLWDAAQRICTALGVTAPQPENYRQTTLQPPFYGMYYDETLAMGTDTVVLLESPMLDRCSVTHHDTGRTAKIYDRTKMSSKTLYDVYLSGAAPLQTIHNPDAATDRELIVFRDSFGSSIVPLLLEDYATVTLVDIRYIHSSILSQWIDFHGQDVLFVYSTLLINNSAAMK